MNALKREIKAFISPSISTTVEKTKVEQFIKSIFWRKWRKNKGKGMKSQPISSKKVNDFVLKVTENKNLLPNIGNLDEA